MNPYRISTLIIIAHSIIEIVGFFLWDMPISNWIWLIWGVFRLVGAIGMDKSLAWGIGVSICNSIVSVVFMMVLLPRFMLPYSIYGVLAGIALVLMFVQYVLYYSKR
ncbi:MAG: hypothetical protein FWC69_03440 [Defluviitaleaceae bacterium]|nr:hypothetical protein [Defluviitaleaceae bacterium]